MKLFFSQVNNDNLDNNSKISPAAISAEHLLFNLKKIFGV